MVQMQGLVSDKTFHLKWNNHLQNLSQLFTTIYSSSALADVTLSCRDGTLKAHKLVLSACSPYFEQIFKWVFVFFKCTCILCRIQFSNLLIFNIWVLNPFHLVIMTSLFFLVKLFIILCNVYRHEQCIFCNELEFLITFPKIFSVHEW